MKKRMSNGFIFKAIGVFLFASALFFNFQVGKHTSASGHNKLASVMLIASAQSEDYKIRALYRPGIFDCTCTV